MVAAWLPILAIAMMMTTFAATGTADEKSASVSAISSTNAIRLMQMEDVLGLDINIIDFDGGAPARQAVISGEVDFSHTSVFAAMSLLGEELRMLAAHQTEDDWEPFREVDVLADVPTLREATGEEAFESNTASYGITVNRTCYENHPERYERLVDASYDVMESDEFIAQLEELDLELSTMSDIPPDEYHEMLETERQEVDRLAADLFE
jgi:tripartite-type tricarboxylate transporter receptor subunit TctC